MEFEFLAKLKQNLERHKENIDDVLAKYSCEDESQEVDFDEGLSDESDISYEIGVEDSDEAEEVDEEDDEEFTEKQVSFVRGICQSFYHSTPTNVNQLPLNKNTKSLVDITTSPTMATSKSPVVFNTFRPKSLSSAKGSILNKVREKNFIQTKLQTEDSEIVCRRLSVLDFSLDKSGVKFDLMALCKEKSSPDKNTPNKRVNIEDTVMQGNTQVSQVVVKDVRPVIPDFIEETMLMLPETQKMINETQDLIWEETVFQSKPILQQSLERPVGKIIDETEMELNSQNSVNGIQNNYVHDTVMQSNSHNSTPVLKKSQNRVINETVMQNNTQLMVKKTQDRIIEETVLPDHLKVEYKQADEGLVVSSQVIACTLDLGTNDSDTSMLSTVNLEIKESDERDVSNFIKPLKLNSYVKSPVKLKSLSVVLNDVSSLLENSASPNETVKTKKKDLKRTEIQKRPYIPDKKSETKKKQIAHDMTLEDMVEAENNKIAELEKELNELRKLCLKKKSKQPTSFVSICDNDIYSTENESAELLETKKSTRLIKNADKNKVSFVELLKKDFLILNESLTQEEEIKKKRKASKRMNTSDFIKSTIDEFNKKRKESSLMNSSIKKESRKSSKKKNNLKNSREPKKYSSKTREIGTSPYPESPTSRKVADKKSDSPLIKKDKKKKSVDFIIPVSNNLLVNSDFEDEAASVVKSVEKSSNKKISNDSLIKKKKKKIEMNTPVVSMVTNNSDYDDECVISKCSLGASKDTNKKLTETKICTNEASHVLKPHIDKVKEASVFKTPLQVLIKSGDTSSKNAVSSATTHNTPIVIKLKRKNNNNNNNNKNSNNSNNSNNNISAMETSINFYNTTFLSLSSLQTSRNNSLTCANTSNKNSPHTRPTTKSQQFNFKNILSNKSLNVNR